MLATTRGNVASLAIVIFILAAIVLGVPRLLDSELLTGAQTAEQQPRLLISAPKSTLANQPTVISVTTSDSRPNVIVNFTASSGSFTPKNCTTGTAGCFVNFIGTKAGLVELNASATGYTTATTAMDVVELQLICEGNHTSCLGLTKFGKAVCEIHDCQWYPDPFTPYCNTKADGSGPHKCSDIFDRNECVQEIPFGCRPTGAYCGNNKTEPSAGEACDTSDVTLRCEDFGFTGGILKCNPDCKSFDTSSCTKPTACGNGVCEAPAENNTNCAVDCPIAGAPTLVLDPITQEGAAGETLEYNIIIQNNNESSTFVLSAACQQAPPPGFRPCDAAWTATFDNNNMPIEAGKTALTKLRITSSLNVSVFDRFKWNITAEQRKFGLATTSFVDYGIRICQRTAATASLSPASQNVSIGETANYTLTINNKDTCSSTFNISVACEAGITCTSDKTSLAIRANSSGTARVEAQAANISAQESSVNVSAIKLQDNTIIAANAVLNARAVGCTDADNDTYSIEGGACGDKDCNDADPSIRPSAPENCIDKIDNNCNNITDGAEEGCGSQATNNTLKSTANDGNCDSGELKDVDPLDCGCTAGKELIGSICREPVAAQCGNDLVESGEDCDGFDDANCVGFCDALSCTCPFIAGDTICSSEVGENTENSPDCKKSRVGLALTLLLLIIAIIFFLVFYISRRYGGLHGLLEAHGAGKPAAGVNLEPGVNTMLSQGYSAGEISSHMQDAGWSSTQVHEALAGAHDDLKELGDLAEKYKVHVPTEQREQAEDYAKTCIDKGFSPTQVRAALLNAGWPASTIDKVLEKFTADHVESHAKRAGVTKVSENTDKLAEYVKKELNEGHTPQQIKKVLKDAGWPDSAIKGALKF